jgi:hypothetical protein
LERSGFLAARRASAAAAFCGSLSADEIDQASIRDGADPSDKLFAGVVGVRGEYKLVKADEEFGEDILENIVRCVNCAQFRRHTPLDTR